MLNIRKEQSRLSNDKLLLKPRKRTAEDILKIRVEIKENGQTMGTMKNVKSWFFEINKVGKIPC